jgi:hypothetical protein
VKNSTEFYGERMKLLFSIILLFIIFLPYGVKADERIDLIGGGSDDSTPRTGMILDSSWQSADPWGEFDLALGAAASLNRALALRFSGYASTDQILLERDLVRSTDAEKTRVATFAEDVLDKIIATHSDEFPEPVEMNPFDLSPSEAPVISDTNPHMVILRYNDEEYLERLLQRLYFKLIQGPVLLTVPYRADDPGIPVEYRDWNNFRYGDDDDVMTWNETRMVYADWDLIQTVVLNYEDGKIACYDSGRKYFIDHTAAITAAGAMLAYPKFDELSEGGVLNFVLASKAHD